MIDQSINGDQSVPSAPSLHPKIIIIWGRTLSDDPPSSSYQGLLYCCSPGTQCLSVSPTDLTDSFTLLFGIWSLGSIIAIILVVLSCCVVLACVVLLSKLNPWSASSSLSSHGWLAGWPDYLNNYLPHQHRHRSSRSFIISQLNRPLINRTDQSLLRHSSPSL